MPAVPKCPTGRTLLEDRMARKADKASSLAACYKAVDERDGKVCRVTGVLLTAGAADPRKRLTRHHMQERSVAPGLRHETANVVTVSAFVHDQATAHKIHLSGDANLRSPHTGKLNGVKLERATAAGWRVERMC
jgi:hypothetical protein